MEEAKQQKQKRTRKPLTPETALGNILVNLGKLESDEERRRVLNTALAWLRSGQEE